MHNKTIKRKAECLQKEGTNHTAGNCTKSMNVENIRKQKTESNDTICREEKNKGGGEKYLL